MRRVFVYSIAAGLQAAAQSSATGPNTTVIDLHAKREHAAELPVEAAEKISNVAKIQNAVPGAGAAGSSSSRGGAASISAGSMPPTAPPSAAASSTEEEEDATEIRVGRAKEEQDDDYAPDFDYEQLEDDEKPHKKTTEAVVEEEETKSTTKMTQTKPFSVEDLSPEEKAEFDSWDSADDDEEELDAESANPANWKYNVCSILCDNEGAEQLGPLRTMFKDVNDLCDRFPVEKCDQMPAQLPEEMKSYLNVEALKGDPDPMINTPMTCRTSPNRLDEVTELSEDEDRETIVVWGRRFNKNTGKTTIVLDRAIAADRLKQVTKHLSGEDEEEAAPKDETEQQMLERVGKKLDAYQEKHLPENRFHQFCMDNCNPYKKFEDLSVDLKSPDPLKQETQIRDYLANHTPRALDSDDLLQTWHQFCKGKYQRAAEDQMNDPTTQLMFMLPVLIR